MTDYEFRCEPCSVVMVRNFSPDDVPTQTALWCPRCKKSTTFLRMFGFAIAKGANGEGFRSSSVRDL